MVRGLRFGDVWTSFNFWGFSQWISGLLHLLSRSTARIHLDLIMLSTALWSWSDSNYDQRCFAWCQRSWHCFPQEKWAGFFVGQIQSLRVGESLSLKEFQLHPKLWVTKSLALLYSNEATNPLLLCATSLSLITSLAVQGLFLLYSWKYSKRPSRVISLGEALEGFCDPPVARPVLIELLPFSWCELQKTHIATLEFSSSDWKLEADLVLLGLLCLR